ncbi:hypothetical protein CLOM_g5532 [Closterium sp. NIES-68]|nr:hypothetical protein CLOM_g5532 [Closterium sp. NIES-68]
MAASHWGECGPEMASSYEFGVGMDGFSEKLRVGASASREERWRLEAEAEVKAGREARGQGEPQKEREVEGQLQERVQGEVQARAEVNGQLSQWAKRGEREWKEMGKVRVRGPQERQREEVGWVKYRNQPTQAKVERVKRASRALVVG